ncbi:hypothetical protein RQP46_003675 [Phenoliferia psychrophenolica]
MSFNFEWPTFSEAYYADARDILEQALNKGTKPPIIADRIEVKELNMGTLPPELEILEIGDLSTDRFRGIFRLTYAGDAHIVLQTKVQANPLNVPRPSLDVLGSPRILFAAAPLVVPMTLRLSSLSLRAIVVLVVSRQKGITLVFKNDPLESVNVSSSFDGVESVAGYIQRQIEHQLREAFRSDLPGVIHRLSQKWLSGEVKSASDGAGAGGNGKDGKAGGGFAKDAKIKTRTEYAPGAEDAKGRKGRGLTTHMNGGGSVAGESVSLASDADTSFSFRTNQTYGGRSTRRPSATQSPPPAASTSNLESVPESIETWDPTYGLRPDAIPLHAGFAAYGRLATSHQSGGLGDILDEGTSSEDDSFEDSRRGPDDSFDHVGLIDLVDDGTGGGLPQWENHRRPPPLDHDEDDVFGGSRREDYDRTAYETIPAVGGGTITRPRVFHTQSQMRTRTASSGSLSAHGSPSTTTARPGGPTSSSSTLGGFSHPFGLAPLEGRQEYFAGLNTTSGSSTPRYPFPKHESPSILRASSILGGSGLHRARSNLPHSSYASSTSPLPSHRPIKANRKRIHRLASANPAPPPPPPMSPVQHRVARGFPPMSASMGATRSGSGAPSEMSDYFPSLPQKVNALRRASGIGDLRREVLDADRY